MEELKDNQMLEKGILFVADKTQYSAYSVRTVVTLIDEGNTVPFIARYRKEKTGGMDENAIRLIDSIFQTYLKTENLREKILFNIEEQGKLTDALKEKIFLAQTISELENLYEPYRSKRKTKADKAREEGLEPFAIQLKKYGKFTLSQEILDKFGEETALKMCQDIIGADISVDAVLRKKAWEHFNKNGIIGSVRKPIEKVLEKNQKQWEKFEVYKEFQCRVGFLKPYQVLALNRGESLGILNVSFDKDAEFFNQFQKYVEKDHHSGEYLLACIKEGYDKITGSVFRLLRSDCTAKAEEESVKVFQKNLTELLLLKPFRDGSIIALDPGFVTGCKMVYLDINAKPIEFGKIFLNQTDKSKKIIGEWIKKYNPSAFAIGNGTAGRETAEFISETTDIPIYMVNESGASVYSVSEAGQEEFPELEATDRGTVSIGRRFIDCLSEIVKVPVNSIGVGMYQHDVSEKFLCEKLNQTVEDVVNQVGVNLNTSSVHLLSFVSGLNKKYAKKIIDNKPYLSRKELKKMVGPKTFEQCAGFLRIPESKNLYDNTSIHPDQYKLAEFIEKYKEEPETIYEKYKAEIKKIYPDAEKQTVKDIYSALKHAGTDIRIHKTGTLYKRSQQNTIETLVENSVIEGIVRNITSFGAFVDIGCKRDGMVHISEIADSFVKDPHDFLTVGQTVKVRVMSVEKEKKRIGLSIRQA